MGGRSLEDYVASRVEEAVARQPPEADVYAFSLWVSYADDDPRRPVIWFGSNTESHVRAVADQASSVDEARWNFAFWRQNIIEVIGGDDDWHGAAMFSAWIEHDAGLGFTEADDPERVEELESQIEFAFFRKVADAVARIHERGRALGPSGRPVPIVVHELEYFPEVAAQNERANPAGLLPDAFFGLCRGEL